MPLPNAEPATLKSEIVLEGIKFPSLIAVAEHYGLPQGTLSSRLYRGWPLRRAVGLEGPTKRELALANQPIQIAGQSFPTLAAAALAYGVPRRRVVDRISQLGWSIDEAFGLRPRKCLLPNEAPPAPADYLAKSFSVSVAGQRFQSLTAACKHFGVPKETFFKRWRQLKWTIEQALGAQPAPNGPERCLGRVYKVTHLATGRSYVGITRSNIKKRWLEHLEKANSSKTVPSGSLQEAIREFGADAFSVEEIATAHSESELCNAERRSIDEFKTLRPCGYNLTRGGEGAGVRGRSVKLGEVTYRSISAVCAEHCVSAQFVRRAMSQGQSLQQALELAATVRSLKIRVLYEGVLFESLREACRTLGLNYKGVHYRYKKGLTIEEAITSQRNFEITSKPSVEHVLSTR